MKLPNTLNRWIQSRRALKTLERIAKAHDEHTVLLRRLVDHLVGPQHETASDGDLKRLSGVSFSRDEEQGRILEYIDRVYRDTGHQPTEDEVLAFLEGRPV